ncbi:MAG: NAD-dependent epimerase/dehydratase family protein [Paracoccus sp. (in: a-proteobacteria)]
MKIAITGGAGLVGRFIVNEAIASGDQVSVLTRQPPEPGFFNGPVERLSYDLAGEIPDLSGFDAVVHAAFDHVPGRYRGGEGADPEGFLARNLTGTIRLFRATERVGARLIFMSSRAVYGSRSGHLTEDIECRPDTLYGQAKFVAEQALLETGQPAMILRATGVYGQAGPGQRHKWADLFDDFEAGRKIRPRAGTEVHGDDLAAAVRLGLTGADGVFNLSDLLLDRWKLLTEWQRVTGISGRLPAMADSSSHGQMSTERLCRIGWRPGGWALLGRTLHEIAQSDGFLPQGT